MLPEQESRISHAVAQQAHDVRGAVLTAVQPRRALVLLLVDVLLDCNRKGKSWSGPAAAWQSWRSRSAARKGGATVVGHNTQIGQRAEA